MAISYNGVVWALDRYAVSVVMTQHCWKKRGVKPRLVITSHGRMFLWWNQWSWVRWQWFDLDPPDLLDQNKLCMIQYLLISNADMQERIGQVLSHATTLRPCPIIGLTMRMMIHILFESFLLLSVKLSSNYYLYGENLLSILIPPK